MEATRVITKCGERVGGLRRLPTVIASRAKGAAGWSAVGICVLFGLMAIALAVKEGLDVATGGGIDRAAPAMFLAHALTGGIALNTSSVQLRL